MVDWLPAKARRLSMSSYSTHTDQLLYEGYFHASECKDLDWNYTPLCDYCVPSQPAGRTGLIADDPTMRQVVLAVENDRTVYPTRRLTHPLNSVICNYTLCLVTLLIGKA